MGGMYCMKDLLELLVREGAEELRLLTDHSPVMLMRDKTLAIELPAVTADNVAVLLESIATEEQLKELQQCGDVHFVYVFQNSVRVGVTAKLEHKALNVSMRRLGG
jgi:Tfp pilus assembly pilus retraction ATPase PilT